MVTIILAEGFEPMEAIVPCDILRRGGVEVQLAGLGGTRIRAAHAITVEADCTVEELRPEASELIMLPGGMGGVNAMLESPAVLRLVREAAEQNVLLAAICAGPLVLSRCGLLAGKRITCYPGCQAQMPECVYTGGQTPRDGRILTGEAPGAATEFGLALLEALRGAEAEQAVRAQLVYSRNGGAHVR